MTKHYFKPIKTGKSLLELKEELAEVPFNNIEATEDRKGHPMFRLFKGSAQIGIVVIMNHNLLINTTTIIEGELKWNRNIC